MKARHSIAEQNARMAARADYFRWLLKYYGSVSLVEMSDEPEPVNLRQIFVPMRVDPKPLTESEMSEPASVAARETTDNLPGRDAFDVIADEGFVCLAGLPGSGKTTLTKALIGELCGGHASPLRRRLAGERGIAPIPIVLREIRGLDQIDNFEALMQAWWQNLQRQAEQGDALDIARLRESFSPEGEAFPLLLLFDGLDETGGADIRQAVMNMALSAHQKYDARVLITGRPSGFEGVQISEIWSQPNAPYREVQLDSNKIQKDFTRTIKISDLINLPSTAGTFTIKNFRIIDSSGLDGAIPEPVVYQLLPLAWPQIQTFVERWYRLRPEWEIKRCAGSEHFLQAMQDPRRAHLLTLARRPIFLTLMALVHCTRNEMPHGRADLYEAIVDLYLNRQERHRQIQYNHKGKTLKAWPALEKRRVLARIAYASQMRRAFLQGANLVGNFKPNEVRPNSVSRRINWRQTELLEFIAKFLQQRVDSGGIAPEDAADLLDYYLHPAGLLISPRDGEISFAHLSFQEYLCAEDIQRRLSGAKFTSVFNELTKQLTQPGWDEVAMLLLAMHKNRSDEGHLELLALLDPSEPAQAKLLIEAICGKELGMTESQQRAWLPYMVAICLLRPEFDFSNNLGNCPALAEPGLALVMELWRRMLEPPESFWAYLQSQISKQGEYFADFVSKLPVEHWLTPKWNTTDSADAARLQSMLWLWSKFDISSGSLAIMDDLEPLMIPAINERLLWRRDENLAPATTEAGWILNAAMPEQGPLLKHALAIMPPDIGLLQGEDNTTKSYSWGINQPNIIHMFYARHNLCSRNRLCMCLYQSIKLIESIPLFEQKKISAKCRLKFLAPESLSLGKLLSSNKSSWLLRSHSKFKTRVLANIFADQTEAELKQEVRRTLLKDWLKKQPDNTNNVYNSLRRCFTYISTLEKIIDTQASQSFLKACSLFFYRISTHEWFTELAADPDLTRRYGLRPGEPLPRELGLFDERGLPLPRQYRSNWLKLQTWLQDDDAMLKFWFPEGLSVEDDLQLRADLAIVKRQPWCPQAFIEAALAEWPAEKAYWDLGLEAAEQEMLAACEAWLTWKQNNMH